MLSALFFTLVIIGCLINVPCMIKGPYPAAHLNWVCFSFNLWMVIWMITERIACFFINSVNRKLLCNT